MKRYLRELISAASMLILVACGGGGDGGGTLMFPGAAAGAADAAAGTADTAASAALPSQGTDAGNVVTPLPESVNPATSQALGPRGSLLKPLAGHSKKLTSELQKLFASEDFDAVKLKLPSKGTTLYFDDAAFRSDLESLVGKALKKASMEQRNEAAGAPICDVEVYDLQYVTEAPEGKPVNATASSNIAVKTSGALMIPSGSDALCTGSRPVVLYAHGTTLHKNFSLFKGFSDPSNPAADEAMLVARMFAAKGYIVVAPNYAGYDDSSLPYHPYSNADQQSKDMIDALTAAREGMRQLGQATSDKLFITGYSQGGFVAMATHRAMQAAGMTVTASAPLSGAYALSMAGDLAFQGIAPSGSTTFLPYVMRSMQMAYGDLYKDPSDIFTFDGDLLSKLPIATDDKDKDKLAAVAKAKLFQRVESADAVPAGPDRFRFKCEVAGSDDCKSSLFQMPETDLIDKNIASESLKNGFTAETKSTDYIVKQEAREAYLKNMIEHPDPYLSSPTSKDPGTYLTGGPSDEQLHPIRRALRKNDLRNWTPSSPVLLCGVGGDRTVFFAHTTAMQRYWRGKVTVVDVGAAAGAEDDAYAAARKNLSTAVDAAKSLVDTKSDIELVKREEPADEDKAAPTGPAEPEEPANAEKAAPKEKKSIWDKVKEVGKRAKKAGKSAVNDVKQGLVNSAGVKKEAIEYYASEELPKAYHSPLGGPACLNAARTFFEKVMAKSQ